jgi:heme oxygenase
VNEKPWTLVSYAWCFYMAIFSGGRWIRGSLLRAPPGFWLSKEKSEQEEKQDLEDRGLSFWHFPGMLDGEDIKSEFKARLAEAETLFTPDERVDIIEEAKHIFRLCATLVDELDEVVGTDSAKTQAQTDSRGTTAQRQTKSTNEKQHVVAIVAAHDISAKPVLKSSDSLTTFLRRPEVTGTLVAIACLACVVLLKLP